MPRFVAFLRAINVGGHTVAMAELRGLFEALGFKGVETFIASGNVIFEASPKDARSMERKIEDHLRKSLGYEVKTRKSEVRSLKSDVHPRVALPRKSSSSAHVQAS